jgi:lipopolysaccharide biosynthesis glycosyltransferase
MNESTLLFNQGLFLGSKKYFKQNKNTSYKGTPEDKLKILNELDKKYQEALSLSPEKQGHKNLLYYAIYGPQYVVLLDLSLKSLILNKQNRDFDLLIITDKDTLRMIKVSKYIVEFNWDYFLVDTPEDGIEASKTKTKIYSYSKIWDYSKILYLDADIICRGSFAEVFKTDTHGKFEAVQCPVNSIPRVDFIKDVYMSAVLTHSLSFFTEQDKQFILEKKPFTFNAGQFYFENTKQMQRHFENINWLMEVWPSVYFFEQSFMNQYFNLNRLTSYNVLNKITTIVTIKNGIASKRNRNLSINIQKEHEDTHNLLHFAGVPLCGLSKYYFIQYYCKLFDICL